MLIIIINTKNEGSNLQSTLFIINIKNVGANLQITLLMRFFRFQGEVVGVAEF